MSATRFTHAKDADILRHNGVDIGKRDYLSHVAGYIRQYGDSASKA